MENKWVRIVYMIIMSQITVAITHEEEDEAGLNISDRPQVEVRAVFINCQPEVLNVAPESEATRFERDELFKHSVLKDCTKKLALTVKIISEPGNIGDEYLPIEHVFEDSEKRVRLLDPYILRLRREMPRQAYMLRRLDTVSCVVTNDATHDTDESNFETSRIRIHRDAEYNSKESHVGVNKPDVPILQGYSTQIQGTSLLTTVLMAHDVDNYDNNVCQSINDTLNVRYKRNERNIVVEKVTGDNMKWRRDDMFYRRPEQDSKEHINEFDDEIIDISDRESAKLISRNEDLNNKRAILKNTPKKNSVSPHSNIKSRTTDFTREESKTEEDNAVQDANSRNLPTIKISQDYLSSGKSHSNVKSKSSYSLEEPGESEENDDNEESHSPNVLTKDLQVHSGIKKVKIKDKRKGYSARLLYSNEKDYAVYEIGSPDLWHTLHVQLFEKLSTPEGKTVWNDLTRGEVASVGSMSPEWVGQDLNVKYRATEWMPRENFELPSNARLCLLVPINDGHVDSYADNSSSYEYENILTTIKTLFLLQGTYEDSDYIVVPQEDIIRSNEDVKLTSNNRDSENASNISEFVEQNHRRITIRVSRAVLKGSEDKLSIASHGSDKFLTLNHQQPLGAQIDLEARADENQLVRIGASGRISIAVSDNTRRTRSTLNLQVGNTGLAAARFRVTARDCYPLLTDLAKTKEVTAGPILIPPRHTRSLHLEIPVEMPSDDAHCSVSLINDDGQSVAVRDVTIKKGDRCFCVWHCDCVCLSVDPKLMCRDMDEARQKAAGLAFRDRMRHTRSVCYQDDVPLNIFTVFTGALIVLLVMGLCKAVLGLVCSCIGIWGLRMLLRAPRKLEHYYEKSLRCRCVEYDEDGWPIHPDTKTRTVHLVSMPMEFLLNSIFFICLTCIVIVDVYKSIKSRYSTKKGSGCLATMAQDNDITKDVFSSHDIQELAPRWRRRRDGLRRWMTPQAQELSTELWQESLRIRTADNNDFMRPLLREKQVHDNRVRDSRPRVTQETCDSCVDSEQDDTDYVLTQMQKSRESLARSQKKICNLEPPSHAALSNVEETKIMRQE